MKKLIYIIVFLFTVINISAQDIQLPAPNKKGGKPLMEALSDRSSNRVFANAALSNQQLSDLLWAAWGINRTDGHRTAPSSNNCQDITLYVALASGTYKYDPAANTLVQINKDDIRKATGKQDFVEKAPVNIIFVTDLTKIKRNAEAEKRIVSGIDAGFISQNIYLYCASFGMNTVVRAMFDGENLAKLLNLKEGEEVILTQTVGLKP